jgi:hypothetical protein
MRRLIREAAWISACASIVARNADDLIAVVQEEIDSDANWEKVQLWANERFKAIVGMHLN